MREDLFKKVRTTSVKAAEAGIEAVYNRYILPKVSFYEACVFDLRLGNYDLLDISEEDIAFIKDNLEDSLGGRYHVALDDERRKLYVCDYDSVPLEEFDWIIEELGMEMSREDVEYALEYESIWNIDVALYVLQQNGITIIEGGE